MNHNHRSITSISLALHLHLVQRLSSSFYWSISAQTMVAHSVWVHAVISSLHADLLQKVLFSLSADVLS
ncbi:hypothetical protein PIB30_002426 [Stylosanthes scabra]|uniref:Uncharacterized protein n=1 Tax=Stylosanthes scabra TaxID=79078 RepID=A0ABU6W2H7_9FABA|nr:hypothetical protein [Stylosanthes scabra]